MATKSFEELLDLYQKDDTVKEIVLNNGRLFGIAIGDFAASIAADRVILNGEILEFGDEYIQCIEEGIANDVYNPKLVVSKSNNVIAGMLKIAREETINELLEQVNR